MDSLSSVETMLFNYGGGEGMGGAWRREERGGERGGEEGRGGEGKGGGQEGR